MDRLNACFVPALVAIIGCVSLLQAGCAEGNAATPSIAGTTWTCTFTYDNPNASPETYDLTFSADGTVQNYSNNGWFSKWTQTGDAFTETVNQSGLPIEDITATISGKTMQGRFTHYYGVPPNRMPLPGNLTATLKGSSSPPKGTLKIIETDESANFGSSGQVIYDTYQLVIAGSIELTSNKTLASLPSDAKLSLSLTYPLLSGETTAFNAPLITIGQLTKDSKGNYVAAMTFETSSVLDKSQLPGQWKWPKDFRAGDKFFTTTLSAPSSKASTVLKFSFVVRSRSGILDANQSDEQGLRGLYEHDLGRSAGSKSSNISATITFADTHENSLITNVAGTMVETVTEKELSPGAKKAAVTATVKAKFTGTSH